ncbi:hypothetical protein [Natronorubrum sp. FCH18a]|uniref:hypothetical protein n=1 Tax=Natronorubrum sp. FCH18a TaxID=3447018 RepID=UPI003F515180
MDTPDASSESRAGSNGRRWRLAAVAVFGLLGSSVLVRTTAVVDPLLAGGALAILAVLGVVLLLSSSGSTSGTNGDDEGSDADGESDVWDAIPSWQYEGRHVESGGLARGEQEQALQDIQQRADELSEDPSGE